MHVYPENCVSRAELQKKRARVRAQVPRHIRDIMDISMFCNAFRILSAKIAQAQNQLLGH